MNERERALLPYHITAPPSPSNHNQVNAKYHGKGPSSIATILASKHELLKNRSTTAISRNCNVYI